MKREQGRAGKKAVLAGDRTVYKQRQRALVEDESLSLLCSDFFFPSTSPFSQAAASDGEKQWALWTHPVF